MEDSGIGQVILYYRMKYRFSQAQVCDGICSVMTLSRIESGSRECDIFLVETLLGRLGKTLEGFEFALGEEEYAQVERRRAIEACMQDILQQDGLRQEERLQAAEEKLEEFYREMPDSPQLYQQFYLYYHTMLQQRRGASKEDVCEGLLRALRCTCADAVRVSVPEKLFGAIEVKIIYQLFSQGYYTIEQMESLMYYMEHYYVWKEKEKSMVPLLYQIACRCESAQRYREMVLCAEHAIEIMHKGRSSQYLADLQFLKVRGMERMYYDKKQWRELVQELADTCNQLYYMYLIEENKEKMHQVEAFAREALGSAIVK